MDPSLQRFSFNTLYTLLSISEFLEEFQEWVTKWATKRQSPWGALGAVNAALMSITVFRTRTVYLSYSLRVDVSREMHQKTATKQTNK